MGGVSPRIADATYPDKAGLLTFRRPHAVRLTTRKENLAREEHGLIRADGDMYLPSHHDVCLERSLRAGIWSDDALLRGSDNEGIDSQ
jgi:hypothetical protein